MQFLNPFAMWIAAGLTVPPLVALYFLKLKRVTHPISSTLLWKKAIEDLHVNAPFQRIRNSLLLWLQLAALILAALALGQPMLAREKQREETLILMIDQSASMGVAEDDGLTRLDRAKREAKRVVDAMNADARAMVVAFCDRATMVSSFDTDREALKRKIDGIEQTDSTTTMSEAFALAEAYSQNMIIGTSTGTDIAPQSAAPPASVLLFTDGGISDAADLTIERLDVSKAEVVTVGKRSDNAGIVGLDARRSYEQPEILNVFATARNFSTQPVTCDATLLIDDRHIDVQTVTLPPFDAAAGERIGDDAPAAESEPGDDERGGDGGLELTGAVPVAFDPVEFADSGVVEVRLSVSDALAADNRAWAVIPPPRQVNVLLVTEGNFLLEKLLGHLDIGAKIMSPSQYEAAPEEEIADNGRSRFDLVIFDRHATGRLPSGNYLFWGEVPKIEGVEKLGWVDNEVFIDWEDKHPILRHTNVAAINITGGWYRLKLPSAARHLIEGETEHSNGMSLFSQGASRFLIVAFPIMVVDETDGQPSLNTDWVLKPDFVTFVYDAIQYLSSSWETMKLTSVAPGAPVSISAAGSADTVRIIRPNGTTDVVPSGGSETVTYAQTRNVGVYRVEDGSADDNVFAVNLFNDDESNVAPAQKITLASTSVAATDASQLVNEPLWRWIVLGLLGVLLIEWMVYNRRVSV